MATYPLRDLLRVRKLREDRALEGVLLAQRKVEEAIRYLKAQREALASFHTFRLNEEERLYGTIIGKTVTRSRVDEVLAEVNDLRFQELAHEKRVTDAEAGVENAKQALVEAKLAYQESIKNRQKIEEHQTIWLEIDRKEQEFYLEKELEDFRQKEKEVYDEAIEEGETAA